MQREKDSLPVRKTVIQKIASPLREFLDWDPAGGVLLIAATLLALLWANSPWADIYHEFWATPVSFTVDGAGFSKPLLLWVNDVLMAIFFFLVGLEIKREVIAGELSSLRKAALPFFAALGGMFVPIGLFFLLNENPTGSDAWAVPMATDIAFSIGILSLLGSRRPLGLIVFLTAFAIFDDIGAVLVIAIFYSHEVHLSSLALAGGLLGFLFACNLLLNVRRDWVYLIVGVGVWFHTFQSGLHPTIAGVLVALTIPARNRISGNRFLDRFSRFVRKVESEENDLRLSRRFYREKELTELQDLEDKLRGVVPPLQRLEVRLEEFVSYFVLPIFALANAGIPLSGGLETLVQPLTLTIVGAMVLGKTFGVFTFSWLTVKLGLAELPSQTKWIHILGAGLLGGIGFTMAIFISNLALPEGELLNQAKLGILLASLLASLSGYFLLRATLPE